MRPSHPQLIDSYRLLLDSATATAQDAGPGRFAIDTESFDSLLQAASYGAQVLDSAAQRAREAPPVPPSAEEPIPQEGAGSGGKARETQVRAPYITTLFSC